MRIRQVLLTAGLCLLGNTTFAMTVVFSDDFEDGDVSNWVHTTNHGGVAGIEASVLGGGLTGNEIGDGLSLRTFLVPPPAGSNLISRATVEFNAPVVGEYQLSLQARSRVCSGCVMSYDILVDGNMLTRTGPVVAFEERSFDLRLAAGTHSLTLGVFTTEAGSGEFQAFFDNVLITMVAPMPVPATSMPLLVLSAACLVAAARVAEPRRIA